MTAIFKRDFRSLFHSVTGWIFLGVLWFFVGIYAASYVFLSLSNSIVNALSACTLAFLVLIPILAMRSFSEERHQKTDQLILTAPVSVGKVVLGKFFALAAILTIGVLGLALYLPVMAHFGSISVGLNLTALLGVWLYGLSCIAICVFISSLTESTMIAAVLSFGALLLLLLMSGLQSITSDSLPVLSTIFGWLDVDSRYENFLDGTLELDGVVYLVMVVVLFLFFTTQAIQKRRYTVSKRTFGFGAYSSGMIAVMIAIVVFVDLMAGQIPDSIRSIDVTQSGLYSISDTTTKLVKGLQDDVTIYVLSSESTADQTVSRLLDKYEGLSSHLKVEYIDPVQNPTFLQDYNESGNNVSSGSLIVESALRYKLVDAADLYTYEINYSTYQYEQTGFDGEGQITSAISYVTNESTPKYYTLTGHGEQSLGADFTEALTKMNAETEDLDLMQSDAVPEDAEAVIINAPTSDLSGDDLSKIEEYLSGGGSLIAVTNFDTNAAMNNYKALLEWYGVELHDGVVMEDDPSHYYQSNAYLLPSVAYDDITAGVTSGNGYVFFPYSQPLTHAEEAEDEDSDADDADAMEAEVADNEADTLDDDTAMEADTADAADTSAAVEEKADSEDTGGVAVEEPGAAATQETAAAAAATTAEDTSAAANLSSEGSGEITYTDLLTTSDSAYVQVGGVTADNLEYARSSDDETGTYVLGVKAEKAVDDKTSIGIIFSSAYAFSDAADVMVSGSNSSLFSGAASAVSGDDGTTISIAAKSTGSTYLIIPSSAAIILSLIYVVIIPLVMVVLGVVIWLRRRKR